ncbi:MAG: YkgJ family cysteine cluster protein [Prolixibacteraceae bacterium]|nr:YkgJ family cysteine cluster protein [Prolixibacteraceae bacterium]
MQIEKSVRAVERLYTQIDKSCSIFLKQSNVRCPLGCGECCYGKNISASPLEFLPLSWKYFREGILEEKFWTLKNDVPERCFLLNTDNTLQTGRCSEYTHRGVICRLFGSAAFVSKDGSKKFSACSILKNQISDTVSFSEALQIKAPVYADYYMRLRTIDNEYGVLRFPVNLAILKSMEIVYYNTRRKQRRVS